MKRVLVRAGGGQKQRERPCLMCGAGAGLEGSGGGGRRVASGGQRASVMHRYASVHWGDGDGDGYDDDDGGGCCVGIIWVSRVLRASNLAFNMVSISCFNSSFR